jgi:hypothetical protein
MPTQQKSAMNASEILETADAGMTVSVPQCIKAADKSSRSTLIQYAKLIAVLLQAPCPAEEPTDPPTRILEAQTGRIGTFRLRSARP